MRKSTIPLCSLVLALFVAGCATVPDEASTTVSSSADELAGDVTSDAMTIESYENQMQSGTAVTSALGEVVRVNSIDDYVIVDCQRLPSDGEEARVYRGQIQVGAIRFSGPSHRPFAAADIVSGRPQSGDLVFR